MNTMSTKRKLIKLSVLSFARLQAATLSVFGLLAGLAYSLGGMFYELSTGSLNSGTALAFLALLGMPLLFAACGFAFGLIGAPLYNVYAWLTGGIEFEGKYTDESDQQ